MYRIQIIDDVNELWGLEQQWNALWFRCSGGFGQSYAASRAAWMEMLEAAAAKPVAVAAFSGSRLIGLWTGAIQRRGAWRFLRPMGPAAADVSDLLLDTDVPIGVATDMWLTIASSRHADIAAIPYARAGGPLSAALSRDRRVSKSVSDTAPYVAWSKGEDWEAYRRSLSGHYRKLQRQKSKRLEQRGPVTSDLVRDEAEVKDLVSWILQQKRTWSQRTGKNGWWLASDPYERFLRALPRFEAEGQSFAVYTLRSGETLAAALLVMMARHGVEMLVLGFNPDFAQHSPGLLLSEICLEHCCRDGLRVDFGIGTESNKQVWSRGASARVDSFQVPLSLWGRLGCGGWAMLNDVRQHSFVRYLHRPRTLAAEP